MKKDIFEEPKAEVTVFDSENVILTESDGGALPDDNWD